MLHIALLGPLSLLDRCAPSEAADLTVTRIDRLSAASAPTDAVVAFDPSEEDWVELIAGELPTLTWWPDTPPAWAADTGDPGADRRRVVAGSAAPAAGIWRSVPLPVADALFADPPARHDRAAVAVNFTDDDGPASMHHALVAIAQSRLLVSEPLSPSRGLEPDIDYLEVRDHDEVRAAVENAARAPETFRRMRLRGRRKAELFRSSRVVARLAGDLLLEVDLATAAR